ncbi:hypothetical protein ASPACDRAFT_54647 [Aspergillus aculeatus ATCC 16872]|uniref:C2H2-type domain-containing protein n=1 Tax=Aspergillus aculeatus (strain ATCC 16872 / CBS 172.66 / WB 5094) TaxID=690307 RepID=A0A1L9WJC8_ASPA1|nr:uncharacterized protein ASPACDRAFT_54647 [Aspergillus aculeatus ATCC 16872]OJJ96270.1 hypothetical protein ASPACDRAFT_54647 [Aspergillus aculeatus ATCC 16872]
MSATRSRTCLSCNRTFSKAEHLTRHLRSHTNDRPYECLICGKLYSRSDVLRRHEKIHQTASPQSRERPAGEKAMSTPSSQQAINPSDAPTGTYLVPEHQLHFVNPIQHSEPSSSWSPGALLDVDALDFTLTSAISEWAQLPPILSIPSLTDTGPFLTPTSMQTAELPGDVVKRRWFTRLTVPEDTPASQNNSGTRGGEVGQGNLAADETYRAGLSQKLQPRMHDEALPSAEQLNLFANQFFTRFHPLLPIVHVPSFKPTTENSLLFISICSVGSLFVGSSHAVAQGNRLFERLNKAILASWESVLARSCSDALSMVQAAIIGQTFAILSGRPKDLILAGVLHGTVMAWARESDRSALPLPVTPRGLDLDEACLGEQWSRWIDREQRLRVKIALNIHDAELASLLHHEPICKHRLTQYPHLASDALFTAPTAVKWARAYKLTTTPTSPRMSNTYLDNILPGDSRFAAYGLLESISAHVSEARRSNTLDDQEVGRLSHMLMWWWGSNSTQSTLHDNEDDPFALQILWHSTYIAIYADLDLLERASGRDGESAAQASYPLVRSWSGSLGASKCLVHAFLLQRYVEKMRVAAEPAIHIPRGLFHAALCWFAFTRIGGQQGVDVRAFEAPEVQLSDSHAAPPGALGKAGRDCILADANQVHRLIDMLSRVGRWGISSSFASVLCAAIEGHSGA